MRSHLKVKVVSLSAEMTYIRRQELKWKERARYARQKQKQDSVQYAEKNFWSQRWHRTELKGEARVTHLAYGAMRFTPYSKMENIAYDAPDWEHIANMVTRFSNGEPNPQVLLQKLAEWLADAQKWYEGNEVRIQTLEATRPDRIAHLKSLKKPYIAA